MSSSKPIVLPTKKGTVSRGLLDAIGFLKGRVPDFIKPNDIFRSIVHQEPNERNISEQIGAVIGRNIPEGFESKPVIIHNEKRSWSEPALCYRCSFNECLINPSVIPIIGWDFQFLAGGKFVSVVPHAWNYNPATKKHYDTVGHVNPALNGSKTGGFPFLVGKPAADWLNKFFGQEEVPFFPDTWGGLYLLTTPDQKHLICIKHTGLYDCYSKKDTRKLISVSVTAVEDEKKE